MTATTEETKSLALIVVGDASITPAQMFQPGAMDSILERIKAEVRAIDTDISTPEGRKHIAALAYKVARTKTFIDEQRLKLVADEKKRLGIIDSEGRKMRDELDALKEEVRKPLTDWEQAEFQRTASHEHRISGMLKMVGVKHNSIDTVQFETDNLDSLWNHNFQEFTKRASQAHDAASLHLESERKRITTEVADRAERARLKAEADEKARLAREAEVAETARKEAEAKAREREEEQARIAKQREDELLRVAAEEKAEQARAAKKREDDAERDRKVSESRLQKSLDDARAKTKAAEDQREQDRQRAEDDRERAVQAERKRAADERKAEDERKKQAEQEDERRRADTDHRAQIHKAAFEALIAQVPELNTGCGRNIIRAIAKGLIPGLSFNY